MADDPTPTADSLRERLYVVIFRHDTPAGKGFDVALLVCILGSVLAVMAESVNSIHERHGTLLLRVEWAFTALFTAEYVLRLYCARRPLRYAFSYFGVIDLMAILPAYLSLMIPNAQALAVVRIMRMMRVFRILKLSRFLGEANVLQQVFLRSIPKVTVFLGTVLSLVVVLGTLMHLIEGHHHDRLDSIPEGMYWAIVTLTTVGYGDVVPQTDIGRTLAAVLMILGYGVIAVPTSIVTAEMVSEQNARTEQRRRIRCGACGATGHDTDAGFCSRCGAAMAHRDPVAAGPGAADPDPHGDLQHFLTAQADCYHRVLRELAAGAKQTHWMWFIFPQLSGLGRSSMAQRYALRDLDHARRYLAHPILGDRLRQCAQLLLDLEGRTAEQVFGGLDALKLRSCLTLMHRAAPEDPLFPRVLQLWFDGTGDPLTLSLLQGSALRTR